MLKLKLKIFFFIFAFSLDFANAECSFNIRSRSPIFSKKIGQKTMVLPPGEGNITLPDGENIYAHCSSGMFLQSNYEYYYDEDRYPKGVTIRCSNTGKLHYDVEDTLTRHLDPAKYLMLDCKKGSQQIFESNAALEGCEGLSSFGIGTILRNNERMAVAGICFDVGILKRKYVKYLAHRSKNHFVFENKNNSSDDFITYLDTPTESLEIFFKNINKESFALGFNAKKEENSLLALHEFEFLNIIQDDCISEDIEEFSYLLNTVWWRNLRLGSWKYFLDALQTRTKEAKYIIYTGTSGNSTIPSPLDHKKTEPLIINDIFEVPEIIWAYVKPVKANKNDEFVVFAYNTPFYAADKETIHCEDICSEIDWLNKHTFGQLHLVPAFGVMHCCRAHEVVSQLDDFPTEFNQ